MISMLCCQEKNTVNVGNELTDGSEEEDEDEDVSHCMTERLCARLGGWCAGLPCSRSCWSYHGSSSSVMNSSILAELNMEPTNCLTERNKDLQQRWCVVMCLRVSSLLPPSSVTPSSSSHPPPASSGSSRSSRRPEAAAAAVETWQLPPPVRNSTTMPSGLLVNFRLRYMFFFRMRLLFYITTTTRLWAFTKTEANAITKAFYWKKIKTKTWVRHRNLTEFQITRSKK